MLKKIITVSMLMTATTNLCFAFCGTPYLATSIGIKTITNRYANFRGLPLTLAAGYGGVTNQYVYIGGEVFITPGTAVLGYHNASATQKSLRTNYEYGLSLTPGFLLSEQTMLYGRVGFVRTHFNNLSLTGTGAQLGGGIQTSLTQNWDVRAEYIFTAYHSQKNIGPVRADQANVGLVYKFD